jgi:hypothetical protein
LYKMKESKTPSYKQNNPLLAISYNPKPTMWQQLRTHALVFDYDFFIVWNIFCF